MDSRTVRVAHVLWSGAFGGAERSIRDLAAELDRHRFHARFFFLGKGGSLTEQLKGMGFETQVLGWKNGYSLSGRWRLARAIRAFAPHVIHDHVLPPLTRVFMRLGAPSAHMFLAEHGNVAWLVGQPNRRLALWFNRLEYGRAKRVIVHSHYMADVVERVYGVPRANIRMVYYGIDLREFDPRSHRPSQSPEGKDDACGPYRIGYVGRIHNSMKGVDYLVGVARELLNRGVTDFELVIGGDGPDRELDERLCRDAAVDHVVRFAGWQSDVPAFLSGVDVLVVPSRSEAFGLVTIEALAMGVRVVAFDVGGIAEAAEGCEDVTLVRQGDIVGLADAVLKCKQHFGRSRSAFSRRCVAQRFDRVRMAREIEALYLAG